MKKLQVAVAWATESKISFQLASRFFDHFYRMTWKLYNIEKTFFVIVLLLFELTISFQFSYKRNHNAHCSLFRYFELFFFSSSSYFQWFFFWLSFTFSCIAFVGFAETFPSQNIFIDHLLLICFY